jgi:hypothetical protein
MTSDPGDPGRSGDGSTDGHGSPKLDDVFGHLSHRRRRLLLYELLDAAGPVGRRELARRVVARERGCDPEAVPDDELTRAIVSLDHAHLPRLVDAGVVGYDRETGEVVAASGIDRMRPYLKLARDEDGV